MNRQEKKTVAFFITLNLDFNNKTRESMGEGKGDL